MINKLSKYFVLLVTAVTILSIIGVIIYFVFYTDDEIFRGAVVTNGAKCAKIGASILAKGGTAVEAAIASLLCDGVSVPNCMGVGGGFFMNIYSRKSGLVEFLDAREVAPSAASEDMFGSDTSLAASGGLAVAVPGELKGYWEVYQKFGGQVPWRDLVQPTIDMCKEGILVTEYLEEVLASKFDLISNDKFLRETFIDPKTNKTYVRNQKITRPRLAKTLELVAQLGPDVLYNGSLTEDFVKDIRDKGGNLTKEDLINYKPIWRQPFEIKMPQNQTLYSAPLPGSGVILGLIMNILYNFIDNTKPKSLTNWQRIIESFKFGFAERTELGDPDFVNITELIDELSSQNFADRIKAKIFDTKTFQNVEYYGLQPNVSQRFDHGTANLCVLAPNGDAVVVTSTINVDFGAGFISGSTGIILNNQMDDFSSPTFANTYGMPPSPNNYIMPGKRPVSSMVPSIVIDTDGNVRLLVGGSGGPKIITAVALAIIKNLWFNYTIEDAVAEARLHHQLLPMRITFENSFKNDMDFVNALHSFGHEYEILDQTNPFNTVTAISIQNGIVRATFDPRRGGDTEFVA